MQKLFTKNHVTAYEIRSGAIYLACSHIISFADYDSIVANEIYITYIAQYLYIYSHNYTLIRW